MTARDEILQAIEQIERRTGQGTFTILDVVGELHRAGSRYAESTIRTHISSRMCANAPDHHAVVYTDLERVGPGLYRRRPKTQLAP